MKSRNFLQHSLFLLWLLAVSPAAHALDFTYGIRDGGIMIYTYTGPGGAVTIPPTIGGLPVTSIGSWAFDECTSMTSITIPDSVTTIEKWAFRGCTRLASVTIPDQVTVIGVGAFQDCASLTRISIPASVTRIGGKESRFHLNAFVGCTNLEAITVHADNPAYSSVDGVLFDKNRTELITCPGGKAGQYVIPDGVTKIAAGGAFTDCIHLNSISIPNSVTIIEDDTFEGCVSLTELTIPDSVTIIGSGAFIDCTSLASVSIPDSVTEMGRRAFEGCVSLTSVNISNNLNTIEWNSFADCAGLTSITIPDSVTAIGDSAFADCVSLISICFPANLNIIERKAFAGCDGLTSVTIPAKVTYCTLAFTDCGSLTTIAVHEDNPAYSSVDGVLLDKSRTTLIQYPGGRTGEYPIPDSVSRIGSWAFRGCTDLTGITIPDSVISIESWAFAGCTGLTSITIPNSVTSIGNGAFASCTGLTSIAIPRNVTEIESGSFKGCSNLTSITVDAANRNYSSLDGVLFSGALQTLLKCFPEGKAGAYTVPQSVTRISGGSFADCTRLTSITLPDSVTAIESLMFRGCTSLTNVAIPDSVTTIEVDAFSGCTSLNTISIPASVTQIGRTGLSFVENAFLGCPSLEAITVDAENPVYSSVDGVLFDKNRTELFACPGGRVGGYLIPNGVKTIAVRAFDKCASLTSITVPASVTLIKTYTWEWGDRAPFDDCPALTSVYFEGGVPRLISSDFRGRIDATLYHLLGTGGWTPMYDDLPLEALGRISNLSTRGLVLPGDGILIGGFVIEGYKPRTILLRGIGPALDAFLEPGTALEDPVMTVISDGVIIRSNDDWSTQPDPDAVAQLSESLGAFPLMSGSKDAALIADLDPGAYSVHLSGKNSTGIGLIELYDGSDGVTSRLVNISTRGRVGSGASIMVPGIVVTENVRRLLIRGIGPELAVSLDLNPDEVLPDPILTLIDQDGVTVATNDNWSTGEDADEIAAVAERVGAFALTEGSADAAILIEVPAGVYTAQVSDASDAEGIALVEVYTAP